MKLQTTVFDPAKYLKNNEDFAAYLNDAFEQNDPALFTLALGDVARAKSMSKIASDSGLNRESLYKTLSKDGNPTISTVMGVLKAVGVKLQAVSAQQKPAIS